MKQQSSILKGFKNGWILTIKLQIKLLMKNEVKRIPIKHLDFVVHAWIIRCNLFYFPLDFYSILTTFFRRFFFSLELFAMGITHFLRIYQKRSSAIITSCSTTPWIDLRLVSPRATSWSKNWRALAHVRHKARSRSSVC